MGIRLLFSGSFQSHHVAPNCESIDTSFICKQPLLNEVFACGKARLPASLGRPSVAPQGGEDCDTQHSGRSINVC